MCNFQTKKNELLKTFITSVVIPGRTAGGNGLDGSVPVRWGGGELVGKGSLSPCGLGGGRGVW